MSTIRLRTRPRSIAFIAVTLALVVATLTTVTWAQTSEQRKKEEQQSDAASPFRELSDEAADAAAATTFVALEDMSLAHPARSITATTPIIVPAIEGVAGPYPASLVISGFKGVVGRLAVRLNNLSHTFPDDVDILLVGPAGQKVILMSDVGGGFDVDHVHLTLEDGAPALPDQAQVVTGTYRTSDFEGIAIESLPAPAPAAPYSQTLTAFNGVSPNGTWSLFVSDDSGGDGGSVYGFTLIITPQFDDGETPIPVPPTGTSGTTESSLTVSGITAPVTKVTVSLHITHAYDGDLDISLIGPDGTTVELTSDNGDLGNNYGSGCPSGNRTIFDDNPAAPLITTGTVPFTGVFRPEQPLSAFIGKSGGAVNGAWKLRVVDDTIGDVGALQCWSVVITQDENSLVQPPSALTALSVVGNQVTLRWVAPGAGPAPTNYVLEGGVNPGETLASLPTGSVNPIVTFAAPTGAFYVRLRAQSGVTASDASNEIRLFVNLPLPPSAPTQLLRMIDGSLVGLAWRNTFEGGTPTSMILDVTGDAVASIPLPLIDSVSFPGVPAGFYRFRLRAANAAGPSAPSNPVTLTFPGAICSGPPNSPSNALAYKVGNTLYLVWEPYPQGPAATGFVVNVTGAFTGSFPVAGRGVSGTVGPGTYNFSVAGTNSCGTSSPTAVQSITIP